MNGAPSPEELAAVVAAIEVAWPRPGVSVEPAAEPRQWRFSGRWWLSGSLPAAARRARP